MNEAQFQSRIQAVLAEERKQPEHWLYLSFANASGFLGGVVLWTHGVTHALRRCRELGINPGGEVLSIRILDGKIPPTEFCEKLLTQEEIEAAFGECVRVAT